ncbi:MAG: glycosyltransferase [Paludibacteraceae bacterium]|nr:glycosyltransferase [Paludibacteraceae bacterium]
MMLSIVTINFNNAEGLRKTLASVAAQSYKDIEHIIVDAASTDDSADVIREYADASNHKVIWSSEKDKGIYDGMDKGIKKATGDYIQILNSGDILAAPDVTERMIAALNEEKIGILYGNMIRDYGNGKLSKDVCLGERVRELGNERVREVEWTMDDFIKGTVNHDPTYIHRSLYEKYGLYDENLKICSDWKWFVNAVVFGGEKLYYVPINVTIFDTTGISETNLEFREKERHAELEKMLPAAVLKDYDRYHFPISQMKRLKKHHLWGFVHFMERVFFKLEKWRVLK